jgi:hypothetical protein
MMATHNATATAILHHLLTTIVGVKEEGKCFQRKIYRCVVIKHQLYVTISQILSGPGGRYLQRPMRLDAV